MLTIQTKQHQSNEELFQLHLQMFNSKQNLLNLISYIFSERSDEYEEANFLIQSENDLLIWTELFDGNVDNIHETNLLFRRFKMVKHTVGYDDFEDLFVLDISDFISTYFQQVPLDRYIQELNWAIGSTLTLNEFYQRHLDNPYSRIEYLLYP